MRLSQQDIETLEAHKERGYILKQSMKVVLAIYNSYQDDSSKINNCMCNSVSRKIYHNIIYSWYAEEANR